MVKVKAVVLAIATGLFRVCGQTNLHFSTIITAIARQQLKQCKTQEKKKEKKEANT